MARGSSGCKQRDITRALKGARDAGLEISRFEVDPEGRIVVVAGSAQEEPATDFDRWKRDHADKA